MMISHTNELLDLFKLKNELESDYAAAKLLGIRPNRLSNYRTGVSHADDRTAVMLADALGLDRLQTIARINMDRARDSEEKTFWKRIANAAAIAVLAMSVMLPASPARAAKNAQMAKLNEAQTYTLCELLAHPPGALLVDNNRLPRYWGYIWLLMSAAELASSSQIKRLRYVESLYVHADHLSRRCRSDMPARCLTTGFPRSGTKIWMNA